MVSRRRARRSGLSRSAGAGVLSGRVRLLSALAGQPGEGQLVLTAVSSTTKDVCSEASSVPVNFSVTVLLAPVLSVAVTVTLSVPAVVGVPEIRPLLELMDRPAGSPVALQVRLWVDCESVACICRLAAVPAVPVWLPGLVTVTVLPAAAPLVNAAVPSGVPRPVGPS